MAITTRGDKPPAGVAILFAKSSANISQPTTELSDSGYATNARPGSANYNWLFNYVSAGVTHCFVYGIPAYDSAETYTANSFINRNGVIYKSLQGSNTGNLPETAGSTYWQDTRAARTQTISSSGSLVLGGYNWEILVDLSVGAITISQLPVPDFIGQRVHIYGTGSGTGKINGGTGLYVNGVYFTAGTGGVWLTAVSATEWRAENTITGIISTGFYQDVFFAGGRLQETNFNTTLLTTDTSDGSTLFFTSTTRSFNHSFSGAVSVVPMIIEGNGSLWGGKTAVSSSSIKMFLYGVNVTSFGQAWFIAEGFYA